MHHVTKLSISGRFPPVAGTLSQNQKPFQELSTFTKRENRVQIFRGYGAEASSLVECLQHLINNSDWYNDASYMLILEANAVETQKFPETDSTGSTAMVNRNLYLMWLVSVLFF